MRRDGATPPPLPLHPRRHLHPLGAGGAAALRRPDAQRRRRHASPRGARAVDAGPRAVPAHRPVLLYQGRRAVRRLRVREPAALRAGGPGGRAGRGRGASGACSSPASYAVMARFLLARGADPFSTYATTMVAAVIGAVHWAARPHLITLLFVALLLFFLEPGERRPKLWVLFLMFMVWANLHGGFVFGLTLLGIYLVGSLARVALGSRSGALEGAQPLLRARPAGGRAGHAGEPERARAAPAHHPVLRRAVPARQHRGVPLAGFPLGAGADAHGVAAGRSSPCSRSSRAGRRFPGSACSWPTSPSPCRRAATSSSTPRWCFPCWRCISTPPCGGCPTREASARSSSATPAGGRPASSSGPSPRSWW